MGHQPPKNPAVAAGIPSLKWPLIWLALTGYLVLASIIDFTVDREDDWLAALYSFPFCVFFFLAALGYYKHRIDQREQWRHARFIEWLRRPWPPAPVTDWEKFELEAAERVAEEEENQVKIASPFSPAITESIMKLAPSGPPAPARSNHDWTPGPNYTGMRRGKNGRWIKY